MKKTLLFLMVLFISASYCFVFCQDRIVHPLQYDLQINYPPLSLPKSTLQKAKTLMDLNPHYKPSWVEKYISVATQKEIIHQADAGTPIAVKVHYWPANTLKHKEPKERNFSFSFDPDQAATYPGGREQLQQYLKQTAIEHIPETVFKRYALATVKFTVDKAGKIIDPTLFWSSDNETVDAILLETICNMPAWKPAAYANGVKARQDFAFMVGDMESCVVNMLNLRRSK